MTAPKLATWNDANVEQLKALVKEGLSAGQIAKRLGLKTRNMVIGKVNRLGLSLGATRALEQSKALLRTNSSGGGTRAYPNRVYKVPVLKVIAPQLPEVAEDLPFQRPWIERGYRQCAWPIGEGANLNSCCAPTAEGDNYCTRHLKVMFVPTSKSAKKARDRGDLYAAKRAA
jgi:hypothetical protein